MGDFYINKYLFCPTYFAYSSVSPFVALNCFYTLYSQEAAGCIVWCKQIFH